LSFYTKIFSSDIQKEDWIIMTAFADICVKMWMHSFLI